MNWLRRFRKFMNGLAMHIVTSCYFAFAVVACISLFIIAYYGFNRLGEYLARVIDYEKKNLYIDL